MKNIVMNNVNWRNIPGYDGKYQADREGRIRRVYHSGKCRLMTAYLKRGKYVVKLTRDGKSQEKPLLGLLARTFLGPPPPNHVPYHKDGIKSNNYIHNIAYISRRELGKCSGAKAKRMPVAKLDCFGNIIEVYKSAREAARQNYCSYQTVIDRCNGKVKKPFGNIDFAWEDKNSSMRQAKKRLKENL